MEVVKKKLLKQHFFEQVEIARQELFMKERQEAMNRELVLAKIRFQQQQKLEQQRQEQYKLLYQERQRQQQQEQLNLVKQEENAPTRFSPYQHQMMARYPYHQQQSQPHPQQHSMKMMQRKWKVDEVTTSSRTPTVSSKVNGNHHRIPPSAGVHGIDRTHHDYMNGEYFCVCGLQCTSKDNLFRHIREMCKIHGTWISCNL